MEDLVKSKYSHQSVYIDYMHASQTSDNSNLSKMIKNDSRRKYYQKHESFKTRESRDDDDLCRAMLLTSSDHSLSMC